MSTLKDRYETILASVRKIAGDRATLLAVSKGQSIDDIEALYRLGHRDFGENYAQELVEKARELGEVRGCTDIRWHFIGHLQTNKVKMVLPWVSFVHTVDSEKLARELDKTCTKLGRPGKLPVFVEVNIDREASKAGLEPESVPAFVNSLPASCPSLEIRGLMCIPEAGLPESETRAAFRRLKELEASCRPVSGGALSMGMSSDFSMALEEGSTHVRVGTALFGPRHYPEKKAGP